MYLGDTSNATNMIPLAKDCDLMIHESTAEDERLETMARNVRTCMDINICIYISMYIYIESL